MHERPIGRVQTRITWLEMLERPSRPVLQAPVPGTEIVRALESPVHFYRYLYQAVGGPWLWTRRRLMNDETLAQIVRAPTTDLRVVWVHGVPAGYVELDFSASPDANLTYFGLMPEFTGRRIGPWLLDWTIRHAFHKGASRLHLNTCDLDHPKALQVYEAAGFSAYDQTDAFETVLDGMELPEHVAERAVLALE